MKNTNEISFILFCVSGYIRRIYERVKQTPSTDKKRTHNTTVRETHSHITIHRKLDIEHHDPREKQKYGETTCPGSLRTSCFTCDTR